MIKQDSWPFQGGLYTDGSSVSLPAGVMTACENFEVLPTGYERSKGYERFDGQASPSSIAAPGGDTTNRDAQRALINPVPGSGPIRGVWVYEGDVYAFRDNAVGDECKMHKATATGWAEQTLTDTSAATVTLSPGGTYRFVNYNFFGGADDYKMYGCDGVNKAFQFDGTTFDQITTGMEADTPIHIAAHSYHLFLAYAGGSLQHSSVGDPLNWDSDTGTAGEIAVGDEVTGIKSMIGDALLIIMRNRISTLYGTSAFDWKSQEVRTQDDMIGGYSGTIQTVSNGAVYLDDRGITTLSAVTDFGNFKAATVSTQIDDYLKQIKDDAITSVTIKEKTQYRLFFAHPDGTEALTVTTSTDGILGIGRLLYPFSLVSACSSEDTDGKEVVYAGAYDGYIYQLESGTSFDGAEYRSVIRTSFSAAGNPTQRKRFKNGVMMIEGDNSATIRIKPEFSYGDPDVSGHSLREFDISGGGGVWGIDEWGTFNWSSPKDNFGYIDVAGTGTSLALTINCNSNLAQPFTLSSAIIDYIPRRLNKR